MIPLVIYKNQDKKTLNNLPKIQGSEVLFQRRNPTSIQQAKSGLSSVFTDKVLLEHRHSPLCIIFDCFHTIMSDLSSVIKKKKKYGLQSLKYVLSCPSQKTFADYISFLFSKKLPQNWWLKMT